MKHLFNYNIFFYLYAILLIFMGYINYLVAYLIIMIPHELGHIMAIKLAGYQIKKIILFPGGSIMLTNITLNIPSSRYLFISAAGLISQLGLFFFIPYIPYINHELLFTMNLSLFIFNLLPIYPLDGYKICFALGEGFIRYHLWLKISSLISYLFLFCFWLISSNFLMVTILVIFGYSYWCNREYYFNKFLLERYLYPQKHQKNKYLGRINQFYKNYNNFCWVQNQYVDELSVLTRYFTADFRQSIDNKDII